MRCVHVLLGGLLVATIAGCGSTETEPSRPTEDSASAAGETTTEPPVGPPSALDLIGAIPQPAELAAVYGIPEDQGNPNLVTDPTDLVRIDWCGSQAAQIELLPQPHAIDNLLVDDHLFTVEIGYYETAEDAAAAVDAAMVPAGCSTGNFARIGDTGEPCEVIPGPAPTLPEAVPEGSFAIGMTDCGGGTAAEIWMSQGHYLMRLLAVAPSNAAAFLPDFVDAALPGMLELAGPG